MKINSITPQVLNQNYKVNLNSQQQSRTEQSGVSSPLQVVRANQYMGYLPNFTGGYSLNLAQQLKIWINLPQNILTFIRKMLESGQA